MSIRSQSGETLGPIYLRSSPEMKPIRAALVKAGVSIRE